jgi:hypothetical protein
VNILSNITRMSRSNELFLKFMDYFFKGVSDVEGGIDPEDLLLRFLQVGGHYLPLLESRVELVLRNVAPPLAYFFGSVQTHDHGEIQFHVSDVLELFFSLGVPFKDEALHPAIFLGYSVFDQLLNQKTID